jgi:hypothetical protein
VALSSPGEEAPHNIEGILMMRAHFVKFVGLALFVSSSILVGCGGDTSGSSESTGSGSTGTGSTGTGAPSTFDCGSTKCEAGTQYCLESYLNNVHNEEKCAPLPASCSSCDCASSDAPKQYPTTNNCSNTVSCSQSDAAISVRCDQSL